MLHTLALELELSTRARVRIRTAAGPDSTDRRRCAARESGPLLYTNSVICISEIHSEFSDSIQFMQIHTEFRYDPPQGRRACEGGEARQEWVELETCGFVWFRGGRYSGSTRRGQSSYRPPRGGGRGQTMFHGTEFGAF